MRETTYAAQPRVSGAVETRYAGSWQAIKP